jgi:hypothetical protein
MTTPAKRRLVKDFKRLQKDPPSGVSAAPAAEDIMKWNGVIFGPDDTPWDGGTFKLTLEFTEVCPPSYFITCAAGCGRPATLPLGGRNALALSPGTVWHS